MFELGERIPVGGEVSVEEGKERGWEKGGRGYLIDFIPYDDLDHRFRYVRLQLGVPPRECIERFAVRDVVY